MAVFSLLLWKGSGLGWYALGYFLLGGFRSARSLIYAQVRPLIHPAQMGLAYGVTETFSALAVMLAPLLAGVLYTQKPDHCLLGERDIDGGDVGGIGDFLAAPAR